MKKDEKGNKPFIKTPEHQELSAAGITVICDSATQEEVAAVLNSQEGHEVIGAYFSD